MSKKPVLLNVRSFATQAECLEFYRTLRRRMEPGERIPAVEQADLLALMSRHPDHERLIGCGIDHFTVAIGDYGSKHFAVVRRDGTRALFSLTACVSGHARPERGAVAIDFDSDQIFEDVEETRDD
jgi:hypothetical protein